MFKTKQAFSYRICYTAAIQHRVYTASTGIYRVDLNTNLFEILRVA